MKSFKDQLEDCSPSAKKAALESIDSLRHQVRDNLIGFQDIITALIEELEEMPPESYLEIGYWVSDSVNHLVNSAAPTAEREELN
jgi:hypothetical protein